MISAKILVKELIQGDFNTKTLKKELSKILDETNRQNLFLDYYDLEKKLGGAGASNKTAQLIVDAIS